MVHSDGLLRQLQLFSCTRVTCTGKLSTTGRRAGAVRQRAVGTLFSTLPLVTYTTRRDYILTAKQQSFRRCKNVTHRPFENELYDFVSTKSESSTINTLHRYDTAMTIHGCDHHRRCCKEPVWQAVRKFDECGLIAISDGATYS